MSDLEFKRADRAIVWGLRGLIFLGVTACGLVFNDMRAGVVSLRSAFDSERVEMRDRMKSLETKIEDRGDDDRRRDEDIKEIRRQLSGSWQTKPPR
jgi:hypothetical protein